MGNSEVGFDIIGDIHDHAGELRALLAGMGYTRQGRGYYLGPVAGGLEHWSAAFPETCGSELQKVIGVLFVLDTTALLFSLNGNSIPIGLLILPP
jgi:hypothetical protein